MEACYLQEETSHSIAMGSRRKQRMDDGIDVNCWLVGSGWNEVDFVDALG